MLRPTISKDLGRNMVQLQQFNCMAHFALPCITALLYSVVNTAYTCTGGAYRTDCIFSPDDKFVITGTSVKKGEGVGKLVFLDRQTLMTAAELDVAPDSASCTSPIVVHLMLVSCCSICLWFSCYLQHHINF